MAELTRQFEGCTTGIVRGDIMDGTVNESAEILLCKEFLVTTWDYRPKDRSGWSNQIDHYATNADLKGSGLCGRAARYLEDPEKLQKMARYYADIWERLAQQYNAGHIQIFTIRAGAFAKELALAVQPATQWEAKPDASFWNANCAGFFGMKREEVASGETTKAAFSLSGAQVTLTVSGSIQPGFADDLIEQLDAHQFAKRLALSSVGGTDVEEAMKAGRIIRERGISTIAIGNCESACTMLFAAGTSRSIGTDISDTISYGRLGFHRMSVFGIPIPDDSELYLKVGAYFGLMGARYDKVFDFITRNDGLAFYYPDLEELCAADVIGVALPNSGLSRLFRHESNCEKWRFLDRNSNFLLIPE